MKNISNKEKTFSVKNLISVIIIVITILLVCANIYVYATQNVEITVIQPKKVEIVLSKGNSQVDITNFETDLLNKLEADGIDTSLVSIQEVDSSVVSSNAADASTIFNTWGRIGATGQWSYDASTGIIVNAENTGNLTGFYFPDRYDFQDINLEYDNMTTNSDDDVMGSMIRFNVHEDGTVSTYLFMLDKHDSSGNGVGGGAQNGLLKITNEAFSVSNWQATNLQLLQHTSAVWTRNSWTKYEVIAKGNNIKVYQTVENGTRNLLIDYTDEDDPILTGSYGFFSYSQPDARYRNVVAETKVYKSAADVLLGPEWDDEAIHLIVNADDYMNEQYSDSTKLYELVSRMMNDNIHYVAWGTERNEEEQKNVIANNAGKGIFTDNTNYEQAIYDTAEYIKLLLAEASEKQYIIADEEVVVNIIPQSVASGTTDENWPNGRWKATHDMNYFENNNGQYELAGMYTDAVISEFKKVGKYEIFYEDEKIVRGELYVHRRPVANFNFTLQNGKVTLQSLSYDLDTYSQNKGIKEEEWSYKRSDSTEWVIGKLTEVEAGIDYIIQLRVKDYQDEWSYPVAKYISSSEQSKPVASFNLMSETVSMYEELTVIDSSYDPYGRDLTSYTWDVYNEDELVYTGEEALVNYQEYGIGEYKMSLTVTSSDNLVSETFSRAFEIVPDIEAPDFIATPTDCEWCTGIEVNCKFTDKGGSGFKHYQYAITDSQNTPTEYSASIAESDTNILIEQSGIKYLHIIASDNAGNTSYNRVLGPYEIDVTNPEISITQEIIEWTNKNYLLKVQGNDSDSGVQKIKLPDGNFVNLDYTEYEISENGTYEFIIYDNVNNFKSSEIVIENIDKTSPYGNVTQEITEWTNKNYLLKVESGDTQSGIQKIELPDGSFVNSDYVEYEISSNGTYKFIIYDNVNNIKEVEITVGNIDKTVPEFKINRSTTEWTNNYVEILWEITDGEGSGVKNIVLPNGTLTTEIIGNYIVSENGEYKFVGYDNVENVKEITVVVENIDKNSPEIEITQEITEWTNENYLLKLQGIDSQSGVQIIQLPSGEIVNSDYAEYEIAENGTYKFIVYDYADNKTEKEIIIENIDKTPPELILNVKNEDELSTKVIVEWETTDTQSGYRNFVLTNGKIVTDTTGEVVITGNGTYTFLAYDNVGNVRKQAIHITNIKTDN